jgi:uncharacterized protein YkwD
METMRRVVILFLTITFLLNFTSNHSYSVSSGISFYRDYKEHAYWSQPMKWAVDREIVKGYQDEGLLKPYNTLTEAQYLTMLLRYLVPAELNSSPKPAGHWAFKQYEVAQRYRLPVKGIKAADAPVRRGATALLLAQAVTGKNMTEKEAVQWLYDHELSTGYPSEEGVYLKTYESFRPNTFLTRGQGVTFLHRFHTSDIVKTLKQIEQSFQLTRDFSVNGIVIGDEQPQVEAYAGSPKRKGINEYGIMWYTYHQNYERFYMVGYDSEKVASLYTNDDLFHTVHGFQVGSSKSSIRQALGTPLKSIQKNRMNYVIEDEEYDTYLIGDIYLTFFYDLHQDSTVTAVQLVEKSIEERKQGFYGKGSDVLRQAFEWQLFDLVNATRVKSGLTALRWDGPVADTARKHSVDMAQYQYFNHENLQGFSPFERMDQDGISYSTAGENIAMGQFSSIFAHQALMNSLGHRKNILQSKWMYLGVGIAFDGNSTPYYAQNFFTP